MPLRFMRNVSIIKISAIASIKIDISKTLFFFFFWFFFFFFFFYLDIIIHWMGAYIVN